MRRSFEEIPIASLCTRVTSGSTPLRSRSDFYDGGTIDWFKTGELNDWYVDASTEKVTPIALQSTSLKVFPPNTVLMAMYGDGKTITTLGILRRHAATNQACAAMLVDPKVCDSRYFFYALKSRRHKLVGLALGGAQRNLSAKIVKEFNLPVPQLPDQQRIASILSAYDDLIENCQRRIRILEDMARGLYREWFVHFRFPGADAVPRVDSPRGLIPQGWDVRSLSEIALVNRAQISARSPPNELHYIDIASVSPGRVDTVTNYRFEDAPGRARRIVMHGDVLWSCVRPNRRSYAMLLHPKLHTIASTGFTVLSAKAVPPTYLYQAVTTDDFVAYLSNNTSGAAYPAVTAETFSKAKILVPDALCLERFGYAAEPMAEQCHGLHTKITNLRRTRDLLLPRLLSGQITLPAAEAAAPA